MHRFVQAVRDAVATDNWYGALALALTLPDICARMENPIESSRSRYVQWFDRYMAHRYRSNIGPCRQSHVFLSGDDCYALRCSYLHEGSDDITSQRVRAVLDRFHFTAPEPGSYVHRNQTDSVLQLQIDVFCKDICESVDQWSAEIVSQPEVAERLRGLLEVHRWNGIVIL